MKGRRTKTKTEDEDKEWGIPAMSLPPVKRWTDAALQLLGLTITYGLSACNGRALLDPNALHAYNGRGTPAE
ncbi:hypothetical protein NDU88_011426 [Pleurodeles waltl]|uniref:Uncharacterized protein n=1 Tax=Pleurodeles waltl TaxID=8319 RepID=A0AAV7Q1N5_PLEWA|nr:hypothetical protein NDU88_011426 [Pleurodeles waltl]